MVTQSPQSGDPEPFPAQVSDQPIDPLTALRNPPVLSPWRDRLLDRWSSLDQQRLARSVAAPLLGVVVLAALLWWFLRPPAPPIEASLPIATAPGVAAASAELPAAAESPSVSDPAGVVVHVAGAVRSPGLYRLAVGDRVNDAIAVAGGASPEADLDRVNLAARVIDAERVYVPSRGEPEPTVVGGSANGGSGVGNAGPVRLNQATVADLQTLPGVGPVTAAAIIAHRDRHGPFVSVDGLLEVQGIGEAKLEALRDGLAL